MVSRKLIWIDTSKAKTSMIARRWDPF